MSDPNARDGGRGPAAAPETTPADAGRTGGSSDQPSAGTAGPGSTPRAQNAARKDGDPDESTGDTPDSAMAQI